MNSLNLFNQVMHISFFSKSNTSSSLSPYLHLLSFFTFFLLLDMGTIIFSLYSLASTSFHSLYLAFLNLFLICHHHYHLSFSLPFFPLFSFSFAIIIIFFFSRSSFFISLSLSSPTFSYSLFLVHQHQHLLFYSPPSPPSISLFLSSVISYLPFSRLHS